MKKAILAVSFGTTFHDTLEKNIAAIENDLAAAFPDRALRRAFTSGMVIRRLRERDGLEVDNVSQALERLLAGADRPRKRPTFLLRDVRLFLNSVSRGLDMMRSAGVPADCQRHETDRAICLTITIPKGN